MKDKIIEILMLSKFTHRNDLRLMLIAEGYVLKDRELRKVIELMITEDHVGIASSERGYSLITTQDDLNEALDYLEKKATSINIRKNCLLRNWKETKLNSQIPLFI